ncbi:hypothetical protein TWF481_007248 [Arthrobotrys musiformis]|uniref:DNA mismatch repair protein S5 domain-containing protein n=1 Tax=Arthrobotrys musiformis TaxID=47236 RepID=A0AAV9WAW2_9PEZI
MIHEIPQESVRRLGSTQVITDPITVVKELIENALDAGATSILIEASSDLVSHIQVKDNGCGIDPNDRNLMAKPHCTSKISTFDDLLDVTTLGFRGEALASLANVSGALTITTRIKDEALAVACEIAPDGSLKTISPVSAPTGCTVKVTNLFARFPVRKTTLEKTAVKYLGQIKPLLLSYYLTHPQTRFQFKCVAAPQGNKGKKKIETKYDIIFAASSTKEQAVIKAFGAESSRHGQWIESNYENGDVHVEAFVVKPDADTNPAAKRGVCIAYKNRPLSITRNRVLAHSIYSLYKKQIKFSFAARSVETPTEPFLFLNILSSVGKVDVNIEPAKDDVLFESNDRVVGCIKHCFESVYGTAEDVVRTGRTRDDFSSEVTNDSMIPSEALTRQTPQRFPMPAPEVTVAEELPFSETRSRVPLSSPPIKISSSAINAQKEDILGHDRVIVEEEDEEEEEEDGDATLQSDRENSQDRSDARKQNSGWSFSMYGSGIGEDEDEDFVDIEEVLKETEKRQAAREEDTHRHKSISNPWTISKMNSRTPQETRPGNLRETPLARGPKIQLPLSPSQTQEGESPDPSSGISNTRKIAQTPKIPTLIDAPTVGAPIARMSDRGDLWYPSFGSDNNMSSPHRRKGPPAARRQREAEAASSSPARPSPVRQERTRLPSVQKPVRKPTGPIDTWVGVKKTVDTSRASPSTEDDEEIDTRLPISAFFGTPDLGTSNRPGDGGRGIFPSASDRMRRERRAPNPQLDDEEDVSSFSEDDEPFQPDTRPPKDTRSSISKLSTSVSRSKPTKLLPAQKSPNKPFKPHSGASKYPRNVGEEEGEFPRKMKLLVATIPQTDMRSIRFRARLVEDCLYSDDYDTRETCLDESELKQPFYCFLRKYVGSIDFSDDTELELLQEDILDGKEFDVSFENLASRN